MAQLISVKLSRFDNSPWGFRLQGGKDFGTPLVVQKVNGGSPAEAAGLRAGDAVIKVNNTDTFNLRHKDAQDVIVRAGNNFEVTIQRGGSTWKPSVTPVTATLPTPKPTSPASNISPVTKTSLAAKKQDVPLIGSGHNFTPKPFLNGNGEAPIKSIVNKQYNSPVGIYSEETIAETLSAQAEVLAGGVLGVNFKKNEKNYNAENSEVFKMVQEADKEPRSPEPAEPAIQSGAATPTNQSVAGLTGLRHVSAPETKPQPTTPQTSLPPGQNICADCERLIVGVFVRIKEKNLHVECFKCSTCGTSLKNVGYYNINNKLYCDIHAKLVARQNPPASGLVPVTIPPSKAPAGTISAALANVGASIPPLAPLSPSLNNHSSPQPFTCNRPNIASVQDGVQRLRIQENGTSGPRVSSMPYIHETNGKQNSCTRNGAGENTKTFTSTLIIHTGNEVGSTDNNEKLIYNNTFNKEICNFEKKPAENAKVCEFELTTAIEEPTTDLLAISAQPFPLRKQSSQLGPSPLSSPALRPVQAPSANSIGGLKPFGGAPTAPSLVSTPSFNSGSNTLPRPQSQNASDSCFEEFDYYEVTETLSENPPSPPPQPPSMKSKSLIWPPAKPLEDITYPTASPLYINPNPALNQRYQRSVQEKHENEAMAQRREIEIQRERSEEPTCPGPVYRRVQCGVTDQRESRSREVSCSRRISRPTSRESLRRSLTPTRITQPTPQPWTATVTTGTNLYEPCPSAQPLICHEICEQQRICQREVSLENLECQSQQTCERKQISHHHHRQICQPAPKPVYRSVCPPKPPQSVCLFKPACEPEPEPEPEPQPESPVVQTEVSFTFRRPNSATLSEIVPETVAICPKGIEGQHDYLTETTEKDVGPLHIKKTTIYEKTVEVVDPDEEGSSAVAEATQRLSTDESQRESYTAMETKCSAHLDEEVENISGRRDIAESAEIVSSAVDAQQLVEKIQREEKESSKEERTAATQQISSTTEEHQGRRHSFSEHEDLDGGGYFDRHQTVQEDESARYEELTEEIRIQDSFRQQELEQQRRQSLREQVEVHQCLREQQIRPPPQTLQERRLSAKYSQQDFQCQQQQTADVTCTKKHVQFVTETESGIKPLPPTTIKNSTPKKWQSEMVRALTTAPTRPYSPLTASEPDDDEFTKECYTEETCCDEVVETSRIEDVQDCTSPFQSALTTAPDRCYTPLGFYDNPAPCPSEIMYCRSQTPTIDANPRPDGYCAPAEILYTDTTTQECCQRERKLSTRSITPRPLPTPPPDFHLRDSSPPRSRSQTPSNRSFMTGLKKPGAIPAYQRNLVTAQKVPVEGQPYLPSRSPTPARGCSKSPGQGAPEPPASYIKAQAPKIRDDPPPKVKTASGGRQNKKPEEEGESYTYHEEKSTPRGRLITDVEGSMRVAYAGDQESFIASEKEVIETLKEIKKKPAPEPEKTCVPIMVECQIKPQPQPPPQYESCAKSTCLISDMNKSQTTLPCPLGSRQSDKFPRTGVCVLPPCPKAILNNQSQSSKKTTFLGSQSTSQRTVSQSQRSAFCGTNPKNCPGTGVTITPCKTASELGRQGFCISPGVGLDSKNCGQSSNSCGRRSGSSGIDLVTSGLSGVSVTPCGDGSVLVAPCPKPILKSQCPFARSPTADLPYPQIPLPYDDDNEPICPLAKSPVPELNDLGFQPIHKPRTNLGSQLTQLVHKSHKPLVQVYKPRAQCSSMNQCQTRSQCSPFPQISKTQNLVDPPNLSSHPDLGTGVGGLGAGSKSGAVAGNTAPKRGRGILTQQGGPGSRVPLCGHCNSYVRGPFITALGNIWCPDHFVCVNAQCRRPLQDIGFVEEKGQLYCEYCFEQFIAPPCSKCNNKIKGECLNAIGKHFHPECFNCSYCGKLFGNNPFFLEDGLPYCEADWNELFTTKCFSCGFPVEAGDRWVEALSNNYHSQCFNCTMCKKNLEGQSFYAKGGRPFCKNHAR